MPPEDIETAIQDMGQQVSSVSLNAGRTQNLKTSTIIDTGLARRSNIAEVRGIDEDRASFIINENGKITTNISTDSSNAASKLYKILEKIFTFLS